MIIYGLSICLLCLLILLLIWYADNKKREMDKVFSKSTVIVLAHVQQEEYKEQISEYPLDFYLFDTENKKEIESQTILFGMPRQAIFNSSESANGKAIRYSTRKLKKNTEYQACLRATIADGRYMLTAEPVSFRVSEKEKTIFVNLMIDVVDLLTIEDNQLKELEDKYDFEVIK